MRLLVTGFKGQLGYDIVKKAHECGLKAVGVDIDEMDITDSKQVYDVITSGDYDAVVHCAAWTAVDKAEESELLDIVYRINVKGTQNIVDVCKKLDIPVMYFSTDYVFNGEGKKPWNEYDKRQPLNVYGQTKYEGELAVESYLKHFIIRISWVFGRNGNNFVKTMIKLGKEKGVVSVVNDQIGNPTYTYDLASLVIEMIQTEEYGKYHATNSGEFISWYDFACEIFKQAGLDVVVKPLNSDDLYVNAKRPKNSRMNQTELGNRGFKYLPNWQDALERYLKELDDF
ncbi:dTDP-4-dehydrorhamnose reductase [Clostridium perfringens]|nr:dTDP-4-dehydrorhamnose reductase [Clostridium perfringens]